MIRLILGTLLIFFSANVRGQNNLDEIHQALGLGDYQKARELLDVLDGNHSQSAEYQALKIIYLSDIGARSLAIESFTKLHEHGYEGLRLSQKLKVLQALCFSYYETGFSEGYVRCLSLMKKALDSTGKGKASDEALYQSFLSRYYALNMESALAHQAAAKAVNLIHSEMALEDSLLVVTFALNGTRNQEGTKPIFLNRIESATQIWEHLGTNEKMRFGVKARLMLMLGNIIQDAGYRSEHDTTYTSEEVRARKTSTRLAINYYQQVATLVSQYIHQQHHLVSYSFALIGLQHSYLSDFEAFHHYTKRALDAASYALDSLRYENPVAYNVAVRYRSRLAYKAAYINAGDSNFFNALNPLFKRSIKAFTHRQVIEYNAQNGWLRDGYSLNPCFDYIPFYLHFKGQNTAAYDNARAHYGLFEYAGLKFHLIKQIMGDRFTPAIEQLEEATTQNASKAERAYFLQKSLLPRSCMESKLKEINRDLINELDYFLDGGWLKSGKTIQSELIAGEAYLELLDVNISTNGKYVWVVTRDRMELLQVNGSGLFLEDETMKITKSSKEDVDQLFKRIYQQFWKPIDHLLLELDVHEVIVNSGFEFERFPFEALIDDNGKRMLEKYTLSYVHDLGINDLKSLIKVETGNRFLVLQPRYVKDRLPMMERLAQKLGFSYGTILDPDLSKRALIEAMGDAQVFHIGAHGINASDINTSTNLLTNRYRADSSYIQLQAEKLWMRDIENLALRQELTVLAACQSGSGVISKGEGKIDFTRVFIQAGSAGVIGSFWPLDDGATSVILDAFYDNLYNGQAPALALRNAKLDFIQNTTDPIYKHPFYWAGMYFIGQSQEVAIENQNSFWLPTLLFLLFMLALLKALRTRFRLTVKRL